MSVSQSILNNLYNYTESCMFKCTYHGLKYVAHLQRMAESSVTLVYYYYAAGAAVAAILLILLITVITVAVCCRQR